METKDAINRIIELAHAGAGMDWQGVKDGKIPARVLAEGTKVEDLERFQAGRRRFRGAFATQAIGAFRAYVAPFVATLKYMVPCFIEADKARAVVYLDMGGDSEPGHCQHTASLNLRPTAVYAALTQVQGKALGQRELAEFLEDWRAHLAVEWPGGTVDGAASEVARALRAVRAIDIKSTLSSGSEVGQMAETRSSLAKVEATSVHQLPAAFIVHCKPYEELAARDLALELHVVTGDKPMLKLRLRAAGAVLEQIAEEFAAVLEAALPEEVTPIVGTFNPGA